MKDQLKVRKALAQQLESLQAAGIQQLAKSTRKKSGPAAAVKSRKSAETAVQGASAPVSSGTKASAAPASVKKESAAAVVVKPASAKSASEGSQSAAKSPVKQAGKSPAKSGNSGVVAELEVIATEVAGCQACPELASTRTQTVFGVGNPQPRLCLLGEAPGADEDQQGEPFVGRAGQLLNKIIEACQMKREDVYILNILKCRPPGNRTPLPHEAANCRGFLNRQLELLQPEFICCLGACAAQNLLQTEVSIGKLRGRFHDLNGIKVLCTYHPAYLLRNPDAKKLVWEDMKLLMREMGTPVD